VHVPRTPGFELSADELAAWMLRLQDEGRCHNINFVTPEHVAPQVCRGAACAARRRPAAAHDSQRGVLVRARCTRQVAEAIAAAVARGLSLPIIYNTSAYDALSSLALMDGLVDIVRCLSVALRMRRQRVGSRRAQAPLLPCWRSVCAPQWV
jgi:putative pyruvate formate lyase activating enzyme